MTPDPLRTDVYRLTMPDKARSGSSCAGCSGGQAIRSREGTPRGYDADRVLFQNLSQVARSLGHAGATMTPEDSS